MNPRKRIWITWENHRRTAELARLLPGVTLYVIEMKGPRCVRYACLMPRTLCVLFRCRPGLVFVQNPSVVLALLTVLISPVFRFRVVVDSHNEGLKPFYSRHNWLLPFYRWIQKGADLTIVTNEQLAKEVAFNKGRPFVLEDPIPQLNPTAATPLRGTYNIVFVCTFEKDEPYREVIESAHYLDASICIYITGRYQKAEAHVIGRSPGNVHFCGHLPEQEYVNLLHASDAVMDLTLMQDCLVCGAYEAVALEKPVILSDTFVLRNYFYKGAVFTRNNAQSISSSVKRTIQDRRRLGREVGELKKELKSQWKAKHQALLGIAENLASYGVIAQ